MKLAKRRWILPVQVKMINFWVSLHILHSQASPSSLISIQYRCFCFWLYCELQRLLLGLILTEMCDSKRSQLSGLVTGNPDVEIFLAPWLVDRWWAELQAKTPNSQHYLRADTIESTIFWLGHCCLTYQTYQGHFVLWIRFLLASQVSKEQPHVKMSAVKIRIDFSSLALE